MRAREWIAACGFVLVAVGGVQGEQLITSVDVGAQHSQWADHLTNFELTFGNWFEEPNEHTDFLGFGRFFGGAFDGTLPSGHTYVQVVDEAPDGAFWEDTVTDGVFEAPYYAFRFDFEDGFRGGDFTTFENPGAWYPAEFPVDLAGYDIERVEFTVTDPFLRYNDDPNISWRTEYGFEDLRIAYYGTVIPEPSALALLGLGGIAMVRRRL